MVRGFESEKEKAVTKALQKELTSAFETEKKLREQEFKAEKELLNLKISNLIIENSRQANEIETLKKALDDTTRQIKEVAAKVIESGSPQPKITPISE